MCADCELRDTRGPGVRSVQAVPRVFQLATGREGIEGEGLHEANLEWLWPPVPLGRQEHRGLAWRLLPLLASPKTQIHWNLASQTRRVQVQQITWSRQVNLVVPFIIERNLTTYVIGHISDYVRVICKVKQMKPWVQSQTLSLWESTQRHPSFLKALLIIHKECAGLL